MPGLPAYKEVLQAPNAGDDGTRGADAQEVWEAIVTVTKERVKDVLRLSDGQFKLVWVKNQRARFQNMNFNPPYEFEWTSKDMSAYIKGKTSKYDGDPFAGFEQS